MKKQLLSVALLLSISGAMAQNYKNLTARTNYLGFPTLIQSPSINTYNVVIDEEYKGDLSTIGYSAAVIESKLALQAFTKVNGEGENRIVLHFSGYGDRNASMTSITGQDGKLSYYYTYTYRVPMSYDIYGSNGRIAGSEIGGFSDQITFKSKYSPTAQAANQYWEAQGRADLINHIRVSFDARLNACVTKIQDQIDYPHLTDDPRFGFFKTTKKADYTDYENAAESAKRALATLESGKPRVGLRERLDSSITFWKTKITTLDPTNDDQDKLYFACANNLALSYYWIDNLDSASYFIVQAEKADVREGWLNLVKKSIEKRQKQLVLLKAQGVNPYTGPEKASEDEIRAITDKAQQEKLNREAEIAARVAAAEKKYAPVIETYQGFVIDRADKKVSGTFKCYKVNNGAKTDKNYFVADGATREEELSAAYFNSCEFGSERYETVKYFSEDALKKETKLLLVVYRSEKITVYKEFYKEKNISRTNVFYKKASDEMATNASAVAFTVAYKKMLANYFQDCPTISDKVLAGTYTASEEMRIAVAVDYSNLCK